ncbi:hypothetical protein BH11PSE12_BH11PSE12_26030 [soil metagenome]
MIDKPLVINSTRLTTAIVPITVPRSEIGRVMGPGIEELYAAIQAQGLNPTGPWFSHHHRMRPELFEFDISVPVDGVIVPVGRVQPAELPEATVLRTVYRGPYEGLGQAWGEFRAWSRANDYVVAENLWEVYLAGPDTSADPADWCTELNMPLIT